MSARREEKLRNYYSRGARPLTAEEIAVVYQQHPWLRAPQHVVMLDGDIHTPEGTAVGMTPLGESFIILSEIADQETVLHENLHTYGLSEQPVQRLTPIFVLRENFPVLMPRRNISYQQCMECQNHPDMFAQYGFSLAPEDGLPYPNIRHYKLKMI